MVWLVADFEALSCQVTTTFDTSVAARIRTAPAINYTACYRLVFFVFFHFLSIYYLVSVCRALGKASSLAGFGLCVGFMSDQTMCLTTKRGLSYFNLFYIQHPARLPCSTVLPLLLPLPARSLTWATTNLEVRIVVDFELNSFVSVNEVA